MFLQGYSKRSAIIGLLTKKHQFHYETPSVTPIENRNKIKRMSSSYIHELKELWY
jgi:hypothetical protein